ncbi:hypothetical protein N7475_009222 [Penicillium sp. IBT 31633x]|nr:hypothetical protein N7475_009222 [Penicillium sp. IBT 31633x]
MAPKRATRRNGATPSRPHYEPEFESILDRVQGPVLPSVPVQASWNYGAATTTALPQRMQMRPNIGIDQMAEAIDARLEVSRNRAAATKKKQGTQARTQKREPTPDQTQLQQSLYNAADQHSDKTPSPPVPRTVSTDSSPDAQPPLQRQLSNSPLYPSPLQRTGSPRHNGRMSSSPYRHSSVDNASVVSWNLERDINNDDLQRTRPSKHGHNITAPPRRVSGLANVPEEDEGDSIKSEVEPFPQDFDSEVPKESFLRRWLGSSRHQSREPQSHDDNSHETRRKGWAQMFEGAMEGPYQNWIRAAFYLLLFLSFIFMPLVAAKAREYLYGDGLAWDYPSDLNMSKPEVFHSLRNQVSKIDVQMSSLSKEVSSVRSEHALSHVHDSTPTDASLHRQPVYKVNFLSVALGAMIDPANTSPTLGSKRSAPVQSFIWATSFFAKRVVRSPQPPISALTSWEEIGDCWCSAPRNGTTQLAVLLGRDIVAEELIVEHIPLGASLEPEAAPRTIELWARFRVNPHKTPVKGKPTPEAIPGRAGFLKVFGDSTVSEEPLATQAPSSREPGFGGYIIPGIGSLHGLMMDLLRRSNPFEPPSAYSDDPTLGPNFYRIGKVEYDLHSPDYVQAFKLNTIVDVSTIRVDKVVFRVTSNWGANHTCIYRLKLHGHV